MGWVFHPSMLQAGQKRPEWLPVDYSNKKAQRNAHYLTTDYKALEGMWPNLTDEQKSEALFWYGIDQQKNSGLNYTGGGKRKRDTTPFPQYIADAYKAGIGTSEQPGVAGLGKWKQVSDNPWPDVLKFFAVGAGLPYALNSLAAGMAGGAAAGGAGAGGAAAGGVPAGIGAAGGIAGQAAGAAGAGLAGAGAAGGASGLGGALAGAGGLAGAAGAAGAGAGASGLAGALGGAAKGMTTGDWIRLGLGGYGAITNANQASNASKWQDALIKQAIAENQQYAPIQAGMQDIFKKLMSGDTTGLPDWMAVDWQNPFTADQLATLQQKNLTDANGMVNNYKSNMAGDLARRGLSGPGTTSTADADSQFRAAMLAGRLNNEANLNVMDRTLQRGDQLRGEQSQNFLNMANLSRPTTANQLSPWANMLGQKADMYNQNAASSAAGIGELLQQLFGKKGIT